MMVVEETHTVDALGTHHKGSWIEVVSHLDPKYGGLSAAVPELAQSIHQQGFDVSLAAFCKPEEHTVPPAFSVQHGEHLSYWPASRRAWSANSRRLTGAFEELLQHAQGVHIHGLWEQSTALAASTARKLGLPYIVSAHGMLEPWALANRRWKKLIYSALVERKNVVQASCLHAVTQAEAAQYRAFGAKQPIAVIPNAVSIPTAANPDQFLDVYPHLRGKQIVLFLGRLTAKKGLHTLLQSWREIAGRDDSHLVLAGPDSENLRTSLELFIKNSELTETVTFCGMLQDKLKWSALAAATVFVLPSYSEGLSVSVLEAMGIGLPVIISHACNMPDVQTHDAGCLIAPSAGPLTEALLQLLSSSTSRNMERGANGARLVAARYSWPVVSSQMADVYSWLQGGPLPAYGLLQTLAQGAGR